MTNELTGQEDLKKELDELIVLAEGSSASIDSLIDTRCRIGVRSNSFWLISMCLAVAIIFLGTNKELSNSLTSETKSLTTWGLGLSSVFALWAAQVQLSRRKRTDDDLSLERNIHGKLLSLLDDQMRRIDSGKNLSIVARATIDIRIKRLDRTVEKKWRDR